MLCCSAALFLIVAVKADSSKTWTPVEPGPPTDIHHMVYDKTHNAMYTSLAVSFGGHDYGVWRCDNPNQRANWTFLEGPVYESTGTDWVLTYDEKHNVLYTGNAYRGGTPNLGIWRCNNPDSNPSWVNMGMPPFYLYPPFPPTKLVYDSSRNILYAGFSTGIAEDSLWRCTNPNSSSHWESLGGSFAMNIFDVLFDNEHNELYVTLNVPPGAFNVWRVDNPDTSPTWSVILTSEPSSNSFSHLAYDSGRDILYMAREHLGVWRCKNPRIAPAWEQVFSRDDQFTALEFDPTLNILYAGGLDGTYECTYPDMAASWSEIGLFVNDLELDPVHDLLYGSWAGTRRFDRYGEVNPGTTYYFAEGTCRPNFDPYICIQNPGGTDAAVTITYMKGDGTTDSQSLTVAKNSRSTVVPRTKLGTGNDAAHDFSTMVTSDQPIIAERPMYFNYNGVWTGGHDVVGFTQ